MTIFDNIFIKNMIKYIKEKDEEMMLMNYKEAYEKSLQMIKEKNIKDEKEYIELVKTEMLLSIPTIEYISGKKIRRLLKEGV